MNSMVAVSIQSKPGTTLWWGETLQPDSSPFLCEGLAYQDSEFIKKAEKHKIFNSKYCNLKWHKYTVLPRPSSDWSMLMEDCLLIGSFYLQVYSVWSPVAPLAFNSQRLTEKEKTVIIIVVFRWGLVGISLVAVAVTSFLKTILSGLYK